MTFNKEQYLTRIHYSGTLEPTWSTLCQLQQQHLLQVPFENLDIHHNIPIQMVQLMSKHFGRILE